MKKNLPKVFAVAEFFTALALLILFFCPWISAFGNNFNAHQIRDHLKGLHEIAHVFNAHSQVSLDYSLSRWIDLIPILSGLILFLALLKRSPVFLNFITGTLIIIVVWYVHQEIRDKMFHSVLFGAYYSLYPAFFLIFLSLLKAKLIR
jgi:hypothetical protein